MYLLLLGSVGLLHLEHGVGYPGGRICVLCCSFVDVGNNVPSYL